MIVFRLDFFLPLIGPDCRLIGFLESLYKAQSTIQCGKTFTATSLSLSLYPFVFCQCFISYHFLRGSIPVDQFPSEDFIISERSHLSDQQFICSISDSDAERATSGLAQVVQELFIYLFISRLLILMLLGLGCQFICFPRLIIFLSLQFYFTIYMTVQR